MDYSVKLFNMAVDLLKSIKEDSQKVKRNEIRMIRDQKEGKRYGIVRDLLLLSFKTSKDYEKCEKVFNILDQGNQLDFEIDLCFERMEVENLQIRYDVKAMIYRERGTVLGQIICAWSLKRKGWDICFIRFNKVSCPKVLDSYLSKIRRVVDIKES